MSSRKARNPRLSLVRPGVPAVNPVGIAGRLGMIDIPADEKEVIKEVPAKVDGIVVGVAHIYNDGSVNVVLDENAPQEQIDKLGNMAKGIGYSIGDFFDAAP